MFYVRWLMLQGVLNKEVLLDIELINIPRKSNKCPCQDFDVAKKKLFKGNFEGYEGSHDDEKIKWFCDTWPFSL